MPAPTFLGLDRALYKSAPSINLFLFNKNAKNINNEITMTVKAMEFTRKKKKGTGRPDEPYWIMSSLLHQGHLAIFWFGSVTVHWKVLPQRLHAKTLTLGGRG
jgi:hypothetical protein